MSLLSFCTITFFAVLLVVHSKNPRPPVTASPCLVTSYAKISNAVENIKCTTITLENIYAPINSSILLTKLNPGTTVIFAGITTFAYTPVYDFVPIQISGRNVTIRGEKGSIIEGGGSKYWDGLGLNDGSTKPAKCMTVEITNQSTFRDLHIQNCPAHGIALIDCKDSVVENIFIDNSAGDAPNSISKGLPAGHNSDGFNIHSSQGLTIRNSKVWNQDDCVVVHASKDIHVTGMECRGTHGLSMKGGATGPGNEIKALHDDTSNVLFENCIMTKGSTPMRIKTESGAVGTIVGVTYSNIRVVGTLKAVIAIQQNYLNGKGGLEATNGFKVSNITFKDISGTVSPGAMKYKIVCGEGSCSNFKFENISITGSTNKSSCNYPPGGCPA